MKERGGLAFLTAEEMGAVDREATERFGIGVRLLMENAGAAAAEVARGKLGGVIGRRVVVLVGKGNNGGDGLVAARRLSNWGARTEVVLGCERAELRDVPAEQLEVVEKLGVEVGSGTERIGKPDLLVDALLGYNAKGDPREPMAGLIRAATGSGVPILALDLPSGLDATSGEPNEPCIVASATVTFGFPKVGFLNPKARACLGELYLGDVSFPLGVYRRRPGLGSPFGNGPLVRVW